MKLSEIKGDRCIDVIAEIIDPIATIAQNPAAKELFERRELPEGMEPVEFFMGRLKENLPALLKENKKEFIQILSAIEGTSVKEYSKNLNMAKLIRDVTDLITDTGFTSFLS